MNFFFLLIALINFEVLAANYVWDIDNQMKYFDIECYDKDIEEFQYRQKFSGSYYVWIRE